MDGFPHIWVGFLTIARDGPISLVLATFFAHRRSDGAGNVLGRPYLPSPFAELAVRGDDGLRLALHDLECIARDGLQLVQVVQRLSVAPVMNQFEPLSALMIPYCLRALAITSAWPVKPDRS